MDIETESLRTETAPAPEPAAPEGLPPFDGSAWRDVDDRKKLIEMIVRGYKNWKGQTDWGAAFKEHPEWRAALGGNDEILMQRAYAMGSHVRNRLGMRPTSKLLTRKEGKERILSNRGRVVRQEATSGSLSRTCKHCDHIVYGEAVAELNRAMQRHCYHTHGINTPASRRKAAGVVFPYACSLCKQTFRSPQALGKHRAAMHGHVGRIRKNALERRGQYDLVDLGERPPEQEQPAAKFPNFCPDCGYNLALHLTAYNVAKRHSNNR